MSPNKSTKIHMYIKILYNRAAYTLYIKAYIKYKNKDKRWCLPLHFEWFFSALLQSACWQFMFSLFFLDKWQYRRPMPNRPPKIWECNWAGWRKPMSQTWNGHEYKVSVHETRHLHATERESMGSAICTDSWWVFRVVLFLVNISRHVD